MSIFFRLACPSDEPEPEPFPGDDTPPEGL